MSIPFAINGLGRIGRALLRIAAHRPELHLVAVNDLASAAELARLVMRDSIHGRFVGEVYAAGETLRVQGESVAVLQESDAAAVPWSQYGARIVVEASGLNIRRSDAEKHLGGGVETVLISALAEDADYTLCLGVNESGYNAQRHRVISNASCTTNCLALLVRVLHERFGLRRALMNEVHGYTGNQRLLDGIHADPRRARAAAMNIVPTTSGAPQAVAEMIPGLGGRLSGQAVRVPTPAVALLDLVATFERPATEEAINEAFREAAAGDLAGLLAVSEEPLVSTDHVGDSHSAVVDSLLTSSDGSELHRVMAWYDNEWGYAHRLADLLTLIGERL
jgi:glyceraldehyde 3-phosphate dehydrogenase